MFTNSVGSRTPSAHYPQKSIYNFIRFSSRIFLDFFERLSNEWVDYTIEGEVSSPATRIIFTHSKRTHWRICLKMWVPCNDELYDTRDRATCTAYTMDGLDFNRRFAQHIYLGLAAVETRDNQIVSRGRLMLRPTRQRLEDNVEYALVMKYLEKDQQLNFVLKSGQLNTAADMIFLGKKVARMHRRLPPPSACTNQYEALAAKLKLNLHLLHTALENLKSPHDPTSDAADAYASVDESMLRACQMLRDCFEERARDGHIRRCHGDLKASNLWLCSNPLWPGKELVALDCIDFNHPEFYDIDTLSDVAMLAIDIEVHLRSADPAGPARERAWQFLAAYLDKMQEETKAVKPLLTYYMAEKAMVCTYMSVLYDQAPDAGKNYLAVLHAYAQQLAGISLETVQHV